MEKAREEYIKKYGVDPDKPKVVIVNGVPLPKEYVKELVRSGKIKPAKEEPVNVLGGPSTGPHAINGRIYVHIFIAKDDTYGHAPDSGWNYVYGTWDALSRFEQKFGVDMVDDWWFGYWDMSDVGSSVYDALADLEQDCNWIIDAQNDIVLGWADNLDKNGLAEPDGVNPNTGAFAPDAVCTETPTYPLDVGDWPEDSVVQHETSHLFNAPDHGYTLYPVCIMSYPWAYSGYDWWCSDCESTIYANIWV